MCPRLSCVIRLPAATEAHPCDAETSGALTCHRTHRKQKDNMPRDETNSTLARKGTQEEKNGEETVERSL